LSSTSVIGEGRMKSIASAFGTRRASAAARCLHSCHSAMPGESAGGISQRLYGTKNRSFRVSVGNAARSASKRSIDGKRQLAGAPLAAPDGASVPPSRRCTATRAGSYSLSGGTKVVKPSLPYTWRFRPSRMPNSWPASCTA